jgi:altronate dehydratase small subunit
MVERFVKVVSPEDNVATLLRDVEAGEVLEIAVGGDRVAVEVTEDVAFGHKIALESIADGETVSKYGTAIGHASTDIEPGKWVHVHNVDSGYGRGDLAGESGARAIHE